MSPISCRSLSKSSNTDLRNPRRDDFFMLRRSLQEGNAHPLPLLGIRNSAPRLKCFGVTLDPKLKHGIFRKGVRQFHIAAPRADFRRSSFERGSRHRVKYIRNRIVGITRNAPALCIARACIERLGQVVFVGRFARVVPLSVFTTAEHSCNGSAPLLLRLNSRAPLSPLRERFASARETEHSPDIALALKLAIWPKTISHHAPPFPPFASRNRIECGAASNLPGDCPVGYDSSDSGGRRSHP
jgi:hypothetical protein